MFTTISFSITLLGLFSIIDISRGNQKFGLFNVLTSGLYTPTTTIVKK